MATDGYAHAGRSMTVGGVLSRAFGAIGAAPVIFFGTSFVLAALPGLLFRAVTPATGLLAAAGGFGSLSAVLPAILGVSFLWLLFYLAAQAVLFRATAAQLDGRAEGFGSYLGVAARTMLPLVLLAVLLTLAVAVGWMLLIVPGIILAMMWSVAAPALVNERIGVFEAFGRSRELTSGARWRIFALVVLVYAIYFVASAVFGLGYVAVNGLARGGGAVAQPTLISSIVSVLLQTAFVAIWSAIQGALYVDLRNWKDGPMGDRLSEIFA